MRSRVTRLAPTPLPAASGALRRRDIIALLGAAAFVWPHAAGAQQQGRMPAIGFLGATTPTAWSAWVNAFLQRMREHGWIDGHNMMVEYRWAEGREDRYADFAQEFVRRKVDVIVTAGTPAVVAIMKETSTIPVVFAAAGDPVRTGLVASLSRPGGNVTGLSNQQTDLGGSKLELLREVVPGLRRVAIMGNVDSPIVKLEMNSVEEAAAKLGLQAFRLEVRKSEDIAPGIAALRGRADALYVCSDPLVTTHRVRIHTLAVSEKLPTMTSFREYVQSGGLMSYGPNFPDLFRRSADYVDKILRGAKPADIPVEQPLKFDLIVNLTTARALGLIIPETFLVRTNQVIE